MISAGTDRSRRIVKDTLNYTDNISLLHSRTGPQKRFGQLTMKREQIEDLGMHEQPDLVELCTTHYNA